MLLDTLAGNAPLKEQFSARMKGRGLSHAYLISGPAGAGKRTLARLLAAAMVCTGPEAPCGVCPGCKKALGGIHPDVILAGEADKGLTVNQARALRADAYIRPNEGVRKVYILQNAQAMNAAAQNALLKLLEEGPAYAAFLLLTENPGAVLPTIRSRCETLALASVSVQEAEEYLLRRYPDKPPEEVRRSAAACGGVLGRAVEELEGGGDDAVQTAGRTLLELLAKGDELTLAEWCVTLEKWDRESMKGLLERAVLLLRDALALQRGGRALSGGRDAAALAQAARLPAKKLLSAVDAVEDLRTGAQFNVSSAHLAGALCARLSSP